MKTTLIKNAHLVPILFILMLLVGCQANRPIIASTPISTASQTLVEATPTALPPIPVAIDPSVTRQTIREVGGGNYIHLINEVTTALDPISTLNLNTLQPKVIRTAINLKDWEPEAGKTGEARFQNTGYVRATFEFMQEVKKRVPEVIIISCVWQVPAWMASQTTADGSRTIPTEGYDAAVESIGAWLLHARMEYNVEVNYLSFNEPDYNPDLRFSPEEMIAFIRQAGPRFEELGLDTKFLVGDNAVMASAVTYIPQVYAAEDIRSYLGPLSFHSWDSQAPDQVLKEIGAFADETGQEVFCAEGGWDSGQWHRREEFPTWKHAMKLANIYTRVLRDTRATTLLYWEMMGGDYYINDGSQPFPALVYIAELQKHFPAGSVIVKTPDDQIQTLTILSLAAKTPDGGMAVEVINQVKVPRNVLLTGLPDGTYTLVQLTEGEGRQELEEVIVQGGKVEILLPGSSVSFLAVRP